MDKLAAAEGDRHSYVANGQTVYTWDQSFSEVNVYIQVPQGVRGKNLDVQIAPRHISVGIKGNPPYLNKDLWGAVKASDSLWTLEDGELHIALTKAEEGATWTCVVPGHEVSAAERETDQKRLMLERFQAEHPGFDFSGAQFTGAVPDPQTFMKDIGK